MNDTSRTSGTPLSDLPESEIFEPSALRLPAGLLPGSLDAEPMLLLVNRSDDPAWAGDAAVAIADAWARSGRRVVLADLHLEEPVLHERVGEPNLDGIVDIFLYGASVARSARPPHGHEFFLIPAGTYTAAPEDVYRHPRWSKLITGLREAGATLMAFVPANADGVEHLADNGATVVLLDGPDSSGASPIPDAEVRAVLVPPPPAADESPAVLGALPVELLPEEVPDPVTLQPEPPREPVDDVEDEAAEEPVQALWAGEADAAADADVPQSHSDLEWEGDPPEPLEIGVVPAAAAEQSSNAHLTAWGGDPIPPRDPADHADPEAHSSPDSDVQEDSVGEPVFVRHRTDDGPVPADIDASADVVDTVPIHHAEPGARGPHTPIIAGSRRRQRSGPGPMIWILVAVGLLIVAAVVAAIVRPDLFRGVGGGGAAAADTLGAAEAIPPPPPPPSPVGDTLLFAVQVRAFDSLARAQAQVDRGSRRLPDAPFYVVPELTQGVLYYKVMAGMLPDTAAATQLRGRLVDAGIVAAADARDDSPGTWSLIQARPLAFSLGEFPEHGQAQAQADSLAARGIPAYPVAFPYSDGTERFRLYAGAYADSTRADDMRQKLRAEELPARLVTRIGRLTTPPR